MTDLRSIPGAGIGDERAAHEKCARLARSHYENFPVLGPLLLPSERRDLAAVYAFCRTTDDLGDEAEGDRVMLLGAWRERVEATLEGRPPADAPVSSPSLAQRQRGRSIPSSSSASSKRIAAIRSSIAIPTAPRCSITATTARHRWGAWCSA